MHFYVWLHVSPCACVCLCVRAVCLRVCASVGQRLMLGVFLDISLFYFFLLFVYFMRIGVFPEYMPV